MRKRVLPLVLAFIMALGTLVIASPATIYANDEISVTIDGVAVEIDGQQPTIIDGRTLVPVRDVFEELGFVVEWNGALQRVTLTRPSHTVIITIGQTSFTVVTTYATSHQLDVSAQIINGSTMLPIRAIIESIGYRLDWDSSTRTIQISRPMQDQPAQQEEQPTIAVEPVIIMRNGIEVVRADETGVHILERVLLTQEEIQSLIPLAKTAEETRMSAHPNRAMTAQELIAWNQEYNCLGGLNRVELEVLYLLNDIRAEHNLQPFVLCPALNRAARLQTNLMVDHSFFAHDDPFYGRPTDRALLFDSALANRVRPFVSENAAGASNSNTATTSWMNSSGHRAQILNASINYIGIGNTGARTATKFNAQ